MTTNHAEAKLRARVQQALEVGPSPDRGRLAAIERSLPTDRARRPFIVPALAAALVAGTAATAGTAYWLGPLGDPAREEEQGTTVPASNAGAHESGEPETEDAAPKAEEEAAGDTEGSDDESPDNPVIYRR